MHIYLAIFLDLMTVCNITFYSIAEQQECI